MAGAYTRGSQAKTKWRRRYDLEPGNYVLACFMPDLDHGGIPHATLGMVTTFKFAPGGPGPVAGGSVVAFDPEDPPS